MEKFALKCSRRFLRMWKVQFQGLFLLYGTDIQVEKIWSIFSIKKCHFSRVRKNACIADNTYVQRKDF
jgi:hypothetical protein